ncbi:hypothetical protein EJB05_33210, partial [Eragrostis curvula]
MPSSSLLRPSASLSPRLPTSPRGLIRLRQVLLAALLPSPSQPQHPAGKEAADLLFLAAVLAASPETPELH